MLLMLLSDCDDLVIIDVVVYNVEVAVIVCVMSMMLWIGCFCVMYGLMLRY